MITTFFFFVHYFILTISGILWSFAFSGILFSRKNITIIGALTIFCGTLQLEIYLYANTNYVMELYPLITHLPVVLVLSFYYKKRILTTLSAVTSSYMCCQPAKWFGLFTELFTDNIAIIRFIQCIILIALSFVILFYLKEYISEIYNKDNRSVFIFGIIPVVYYLFDYSVSIYTNLWNTNNRTVVEFLPFLLCIVYFLFCILYHKEYEKKQDAERKEQIIRITTEQQRKELETIKRNDYELRLYRHDMRLFLNNLLACMDENPSAAKEMIRNYSDQIEATALHYYCGNITVNSVLSVYAAKCLEKNVQFDVVVNTEDFPNDEISFSSILSNALDNALNVQNELAVEKRFIKVSIKTSGNKLLLSVKNTYQNAPVFRNGYPVSQRIGHGYGTQSIRYMTERLGGNCQFTIENHIFILRVII